ncbi:hypothetical protein BpHYR1_035577 [Brachionus plicatilis]|uniref:Uncharacterized protein n=1 Tax=Brachionus plicatilis TaxID=10195 RepID=A0A3M7RAJ7_BRAPC|nr:hypothetical protein BpHYR1_035577 [Brachionus plicatilis]
MSIETSHSSPSELSNATKPALPPKPKLALAESKHPAPEPTNSDNYNALINSLREKLNINVSGSVSHSSLALSALSSSSDIAGLKSFNLDQNMSDLSLLDEIYAEIEDKYLFQKAKSANPKAIQSSCSCSHSSQSSQSSCSCSYTSEPVADRPPLPSVPPPNLVSCHSDDKRMSLSLEEEIALEIRAKLNQEYLVSKKVEARTERREDKMEQSVESAPDTPVLEPEYLEPISLGKPDKKMNEKKTNKVMSNPGSPKTNSDFILSPSKLKSYLIKSPSSKNPPLDPSQSRTFSYLLKQSNRITSTLRLMRTKSSSNHVHNQSIYSQPIEQKCYQSTVNICQEHNQVEISQPTLISQTFDLNNQALIEIKNGKNQGDGLRSSLSSFNSSFDTSSTSSVCSPKTEYEHKNHDSIDGCTKKFHDHSPTIESNLIITNVYEEDDLIATHQQTKHNTNTNNSGSHYASNSVINKPLPTVPSSNVNSRQSNKENGPSNSVNNFQNQKKILENLFSSSNSSSVSTSSSISSTNGQNISKSNDINKSRANGEVKKMAPPVPPPRQDLTRDDTMINKYQGQSQIPAFPKPVRAPSPSSGAGTPQFPTTNKPPPPPPMTQQHPPLPPAPSVNQAPVQPPSLPPYNRNVTKPANAAPPPPPPPVAPPPIPEKYNHHPPPPPPPNQPPPPPPPSRPAPPRPPPQPPTTKLIDDLDRRFQFLPLPSSAELPRVFSPPNDREYPSAKYEVKMRSNGNH